MKQNDTASHTINPYSVNSDDLPMVAIIGPTNAGKSTLFNRLTGSRLAVTAKETSTTRDRIYGEANWQNHYFTIIDTGGLAEDESDLYQKINQQMNQAIEEADLVLFLYDGQEGLKERDKQLISHLRHKKSMILVANKVDSFRQSNNTEDLSFLGLPFFEISAINGRALGDVLEEVVKLIPEASPQRTELPSIAIIGRPNVGKSTLLNALSQTNRSIVSPVAGTTRDLITQPITIANRSLLLVDTAGVRRSGRIKVGPEDFSVKRALSAISQSDAVLLIADATEGVTRGDLHLLYYAKALNKPALVVFNKTDRLIPGTKPSRRQIVKFETIFISALKKYNLTKIQEWLAKLPSANTTSTV